MVDLKKIRQVLNLSQAEFSRVLHLSKSAVCMIEQGKRTLTDRTVEQICVTFNLNRDWVVNGVGEPFAEVPEVEEIDDFILNLSKSYNNMTAEDKQFFKDFCFKCGFVKKEDLTKVKAI